MAKNYIGRNEYGKLKTITVACTTRYSILLQDVFR